MKKNSFTIDDIHSFYLEWLSKHNTILIDKKRAFPTAIIASKIFSFPTYEKIMAFGKSTLWLFGVDRWFDERDYSETVLLSKIRRILFCSKDTNLDDDEEKELWGALRDINSDFPNKIFNSVYIQSALNDTLFYGMLGEHRAKALGKSFDSFENYLSVGRESIGVRYVNSLVVNSISLNLIEKYYIEIANINRISSEIIRLVNDKVTLPKEILEGNKNFFTEFKCSDSEFELLISSKRKELLQFSKKGSNELGEFFDYVNNLVNSTIEFYSESDFYDDNSDLNKKYNDSRQSNKTKI